MSKDTNYHDLIEIGDTFIDPMDGDIREVASKGQMLFGGKDGKPYWDDSIITTDGGCVSAEEVFNNLTH